MKLIRFYIVMIAIYGTSMPLLNKQAFWVTLLILTILQAISNLLATSFIFLF